jgi:maltose O-acetyltransferase
MVNSVAASPLVSVKLRNRLYRRAGMSIGTRVLFRPHCWVFDEQLTIGDDTYIGYGCPFETQRAITIGARCAISYDVSIVTSTHEVGAHDRRAGAYAGAPVVVGDGCWIGTRAVILPGVTIGDGCVIAAGAVVVEGCEPDGVYAGVPATRVREL